MEYWQGFDFAHLQPQDHHPYQHPQYQPQYDDSRPAEEDPGQGLLSDLAAKLGISLEEFLQQWAQITASGDQQLSFLTEDLHINVNGSLYEPAHDYCDGEKAYNPGTISVEQPMVPDQELCLASQMLFVSPSQNALPSNHGGGMLTPPEHVFAPIVPSNVYRDAACSSVVPEYLGDIANTTNTDIAPQAESQSLPIPIMYPFPDPRKLGQLRPGYYHLLSMDTVPTLQDKLQGSFAPAMRDVVLIVPRPPDFVGNPSLPAILFIDLNRHGRPGPYVRDILNGKAKLQGAKEWVLEHNTWKTTPLRLNWPGCITCSEVISCTNQRGQPLSRAEIAHIVASKVIMLFQEATMTRKFVQTIDANTAPWDLRRINPMKVRLIGVSYYRKLWVSILATNARSSIWNSAVGPFPAVARPDRIFPPAHPRRTRPGAFRP